MVFITDDSERAAQKIQHIANRFGIQVHPSDTTGSEPNLTELLASFPVSTKQGLISFRENNAENYLSEALLFAETSGTTGKPLQIPRTYNDLITGVRNYATAYLRYLSPGRDRVAFVHPSLLSPLRDITVRTLQDHNIGIMTVFPIPGQYTYDRIHAALDNNKVTTLMSSPSSIHQILYNFDLHGLPFPASIERIFVTGEYFSRSQAGNIKRIIGREIDIIPIVYGANEIGMMMYGDQDLAYRGFTEDFVFESIPIENHSEFVERLDHGAHLGELLVTSLTPSSMPIIRYATKDVFIFKPDTDGSWRFTHVGRNESLPLDLRTRNLIDEVMYSLPEPIFHYSVKIADDASSLTAQVLQPREHALLPGTIHDESYPADQSK
ncbi:MAG: hypothetical protein DI546_03620 [Rhizobium sp.]|nr:MAG: hypothetical protein DI546_03620 [Rhizobium sp.]